MVDGGWKMLEVREMESFGKNPGLDEVMIEFR
jgi:hypothetical protein